jgi:hypothetical protein
MCVPKQKIDKRHEKRLAVAALLLFLTQAMPAFSQPTPINLDLSSTQRVSQPTNIPAPVGINVGGSIRSVNPNDLMTPAERIALEQVIQTGMQSIALGANGNAIGGQINLSGINESIASLLIPSGVTAVRDFGHAFELNILGTLNNAGKLYAFSTNHSVTTAVINANDIFNQQGALITSIPNPAVLPDGAHVVKDLSLILNSKNNILNSGVISSARDLTLNARNWITNKPILNYVFNTDPDTGIMAAHQAIGEKPVIHAERDVNLRAAVIENLGMIVSEASDINIRPAENDLRVASVTTYGDEINGVMQALKGAINIGIPIQDAHDVATPEVANSQFLKEPPKVSFRISGGDFLSRELNIYGDGRAVSLTANEVTGTVNINAQFLLASVQKGMFNLGNLNLTSPPVSWNSSPAAIGNYELNREFDAIYNFDPNGGINILGTISHARPISLFANGTITGAPIDDNQMNVVSGANIPLPERPDPSNSYMGRRGVVIIYGPDRMAELLTSTLLPDGTYKKSYFDEAPYNGSYGFMITYLDPGGNTRGELISSSITLPAVPSSIFLPEVPGLSNTVIFPLGTVAEPIAIQPHITTPGMSSLSFDNSIHLPVLVQANPAESPAPVPDIQSINPKNSFAPPQLPNAQAQSGTTSPASQPLVLTKRAVSRETTTPRSDNSAFNNNVLRKILQLDSAPK